MVPEEPLSSVQTLIRTAVVRLRRDPALMGGRRTGRACGLQKARGIWVVTRESNSRPIQGREFFVFFFWQM
ncbi:hypothetical protein ACWIE6_09975 [Paenibacillus taichungensis]|uniref:hypothetical protein n=1 Tax=Paenibacillus taichungensis TaxID=484184 RepID=UPI0035DC0457